MSKVFDPNAQRSKWAPDPIPCEDCGTLLDNDWYKSGPQAKVCRSCQNKRYLYGEQGGYCNGCEHHFEMRHLEVDHIIARSNGGTDHISNLQLLCGACDAMKGTKTQAELLVMLTDKGWIKRRKTA